MGNKIFFHLFNLKSLKTISKSKDIVTNSQNTKSPDIINKSQATDSNNKPKSK